MTSKKWLKYLAFSILIFIPFVFLFNCLIDPLGITNYSHKFNKYQSGFNERLQKTIWYKKTNNIDSILIGSSRATYYNTNDLKGMNVFNFAVSNIMPIEYQEIVDYADSISNIKNIILVLDFYGIKKDKKSTERLNSYKTNDNQLVKYFSINMIKHSLTNLKMSFLNRTGHRAYDRKGIVHVDKVSENDVEKIALVRSQTYWKDLEYNPDYKKILNDFKNKNKDKNIVVLTTPLSKPFLKKIYNNYLLKDYYFRWIKDITSTFKEVYFYTMPSPLSDNYTEYSKDGDHYYPEVGTKLINLSVNYNRTEHYGVLLNNNNLNHFFEDINKFILDLNE